MYDWVWFFFLILAYNDHSYSRLFHLSFLKLPFFFNFLNNIYLFLLNSEARTECNYPVDTGKDVKDFFWKSSVRSIYVLCLRGKKLAS